MPDEIDHHASAAETRLVTHLRGLMECAESNRFDGLDFHLRGARECVDLLEGPDREVGHTLTEAVGEFTTAMREGARGTPESRREAAVRLRRARELLRALEVQQPESLEIEGIAQLVIGIEAYSLPLEAAVARDRGDKGEAARLETQMRQVRGRLLERLPPDDPSRPFIASFEIIDDAVGSFHRASKAVEELNLSAAVSAFAHAEARFRECAGLLASAPPDVSTHGVYGRAIQGYLLMGAALRTYARVLASAVRGGAHRADVEALSEAADNVRQGGEIIMNATRVTPFFGFTDWNERADIAARRMLQLKLLCLESFKPREVFLANAAPRAVLFFLLTFLVLVAALPATGLITSLNLTTLAAILGVALLVAVIGAFGTEATRLTSLFDSVTRLVTSLSPRKLDVPAPPAAAG